MQNAFRNWSDIRIFLCVVREGSTLAASRQLGIAQPTVARRIDVLEHELGLTLFDRDTRGFRPTDHAMVLMPLAETMEQAAAALAQKAGDLTTIRPIRITAYAANFSPRIMDILNDYSLDNPQISFELLPSVRSLDLLSGETDIALRLARTPPDRTLIQRKISTARWSLFGAPAYAKTHDLPASERELAGHRFVTFQRKDVPNALHDWLSRNVLPDQIVRTYSELDLMHSAIRSGHGLGITNVRLVQDDPDMVRCFDEIEELTVPHLLLVSPQAYRRDEVRRFVKYFAPRYTAFFK